MEEKMARWISLLILILVSATAYAEIKPRAALLMPEATKAVFLDLAAHNEKIFAVGERGIIIRSDDQGDSWQQIASPMDVTLTSIKFSSANVGWIVGHESTILRTDDGGDSWQISQYKPEADKFYMSVNFVSAEQGYVLGTDGELWVTADAGKSWQLTVLSVEEWFQNHLFGIETIGSSSLVAAERGGVFYSKNGLTDWQTIPSPYEGSYFGVNKLANNFLIYGMSGRVYLLDAISLQWTKIDVGTDQFLLDATQLAGNRGAIVVGRGGVILYFDEQGKLQKKSERQSRVDFTAVTTSKQNVYLASMAGGIEKVSISSIVK